MSAPTPVEPSSRRVTCTPPAGRRRARWLPALLLAVAAPLAAGTAGAQGVLLELRPRPGDTLRLRLQQEVEVVATRTVRGVDSTVTMHRHTTVFSRSVAMRNDAKGAIVLAITDSMLVREGDGRTVHSGLGSRATLHVAPDGGTRVLDDGGMLSQETVALVSQMPGTLPRRAVMPGTSWTQTTAMPIPGQSAAQATGRLVATFRLDSLSRWGDVAYVSLRGTLERPKGGKTRGGALYESAGSMVGSFQVDRRRGWLIAVRATITTRSSVTPQGLGAAPVHVNTRVTQWLQALDAVDKD